MNEITRTTSTLPLPEPKVELSFRLATMDDLPWMDRLQKMHSKQLGYWPTKQFEGYIAMGGVLVAWASRPCAERAEGSMGETPMPLGYVISRDRYLKRDELGVIYQLCVVPGAQRGYVGAALIREVFNRSAYGCRLYCCWCAQDLAANYFWESLGFVPLAFRAGSEKKSRVHIFWQKKIDPNDQSDNLQSKINNLKSTPYWYPFQTNSGAIRADRIVFPIPPGTHWTEVEAIAAPTAPVVGSAEDSGLPSALRLDSTELIEVRLEERTEARKKALPGPRTQTSALRPQSSAPPSLMRGFSFAPSEPVKPVKEKARKARKAKPVATRIDPMFLAAARELRDRSLEQVNVHPMRGVGTYDVTRRIAGRAAALLEAA